MLAWRGDGSQLLHQAQQVRLGPTLHYPALRDAVYVYLCHRNPITGRGNAHKWPLVGSLPREAVHHLISLGDHILDCEAHVRKGEAEHVQESFLAFEIRWCPRLVIDELRGEDLI